MNVKLVSITKSMVEEKELTAEELITYTARVSNPGNQLNTDTAPNLLRFLMKKKHWSPFEMADFCVEIVTSRAIAQQIIRHRSFSFQEFSQRYAEVTEFEPIQLRKQSAKNRQSSTEEFKNEIIERSVGDFIKAGEHLYKALLGAGVAKECARMVLPLTTQTKIYMKGSVRSWIHYLGERTSEHTQLEHQQIALKVLAIFQTHFPDICEAMTAANGSLDQVLTRPVDKEENGHA